MRRARTPIGASGNFKLSEHEIDGWVAEILVRAECVRQHSEVAIKLAIIFSLFWSFCFEQTWSLVG